MILESNHKPCPMNHVFVFDVDRMVMFGIFETCFSSHLGWSLEEEKQERKENYNERTLS